jgi:hypothetical protein
MMSLTEKPIARSATSWLSRPVKSSAGLTNYIDRQDAVAFWLAYSFAFDDTEPLPAMFRRKTPAVNAEAPLAAGSRFRGSAFYIFACVSFLFLAADAALTRARFSHDQAAVALAAPERGVAETVALSPWIEVAEESQAAAFHKAEGRLLRRTEAGLSASTETPAEAPGVCGVPSPNCWKTFIR